MIYGSLQTAGLVLTGKGAIQTLRNAKCWAAKVLGRWHPDVLFQCRCGSIGTLHRYATGLGALPLCYVTLE